MTTYLRKTIYGFLAAILLFGMFFSYSPSAQAIGTLSQLQQLRTLQELLAELLKLQEQLNSINDTQGNTQDDTQVDSQGQVGLSWSNLGSKYLYSLDVKPKGKSWVGPCVNAGVLKNSTSHTYNGNCQNNKKVSADNVEKFRICALNSFWSWGKGYGKCGVVNHTKGQTAHFINVQLDRSDTTPENPDVMTGGFTSGGPSVVKLNDGSLLSMRRADNGKIVDNSTILKTNIQRRYDVDVYRSTDNGDTWSYWSRFLSITVPSDQRKFPGNMHTIQLPNGRLLTSYRIHTDAGASVDNDSRWDRYRLRVRKSDDNGKTWQDHSVIADLQSTDSTLGLWEPVLIQPSKRSGKLQVYYAKERPSSQTCSETNFDAQDIVMKESGDGGKTWGSERTVARRGLSREGVPAVTELTDGSLLLAIETYFDSSCTSTSNAIKPGLLRSSDGGMSWSYLPDPYNYSEENARGGWPHMITLKDGRVLLKFSPNENHLDTLSDPAWSKFGGMRDIKFLISSNVPSYNKPPQWSEPALAVHKARWGQITQNANGDIVTVSNEFKNNVTNYRVIPLDELNDMF